MTARELIKALQDLGELDKEIVIFDGPSYFTPSRIMILKGKCYNKELQGTILID